MSNLKFNRVYYEKYNNNKINIGNALKEHYEILKIDKTKYVYQKAVVQLDQPDLCDLIKVWEAQINEYLKGEGIPPIKFYTMIRFILKLHNPSDASIITIKSVWINDENKPFIQLWLE